jgi:general L-amino acid transport system permease protein
MTATARPAHASVPLWRNVRVIRVAAQVGVVLLVFLLLLFLWNNLTTSMTRARMSFGFDFLDSRAGFEIAEGPLAYTAANTYGRAYLVGLSNTLLISVSGIVLATVLGVIVGVARLSTNWLVARIAAGYVELMRNTPLLVQLVLLYAVFLQLPSVANSFTLPGSIFLNQRGVFLPRPDPEPTFGLWLGFIAAAIVLAIGARAVAARLRDAGRPTYRIGWIGLGALIVVPLIGWFAIETPLQFEEPVLDRFNFVGGIGLSPEFTALLLGLVIYTAAFIGEVVRGGIQAVRRGQLEAAQALGLSAGQTLRLIVFPQALRIIVPPLTSQYLNLAKNSSLAIAIGFPDLFSVSQTMANQTGQPVPVIILVMGTYLAISLFTSLLMNLYNRRVQVLER